MCGIVGAVADRNVVPLLLEGLRRLEYRGYDSAGVAVLDDENKLDRVRSLGKVATLTEAINNRLNGHMGIAHTRWATHGEPSQSNAHPHICRSIVSVVHNGIIENHEQLRKDQNKRGFEFTSETDTEVVVHQIYGYHVDESKDLLSSVRATIEDLEGAYALGVISANEKGRMIAARRGSPLVIGMGIEEYFIASDVAALLPVTQRFMFLEEGDIADIRTNQLVIYNEQGDVVERPVRESEMSADSVERGEYRHYMLKEIY